MEWAKLWKKKKMIENETIPCREAAKELAEQFRGNDWFKTAYCGLSDDGIDAIFFVYKDRNPEKHRLYIYRGFPVLMRPSSKSNVKSTDLSDGCIRAK